MELPTIWIPYENDSQSASRYACLYISVLRHSKEALDEVYHEEEIHLTWIWIEYTSKVPPCTNNILIILTFAK